MSHATNVENSNGNQTLTSLGLSRPPIAPLGNDGKPLRTSVCDEIDDSIRKAAKIEQELQNSKVH